MKCKKFLWGTWLSPNKVYCMFPVCLKTERRKKCLKYCKTHTDDESYIKANPNWEYVGIYYDEGISGTKKENRTELIKMLSDCEKGKIDLIITKSISRFARNTTDCKHSLKNLEK